MPTAGYGRVDNGLRSARDIIEYRARNSSQINVAITAGRPRVLHRSIIPPSITRIDLSRAASFVCRPGGFPEQMIPSHGSHFTFSRLSFHLRRRHLAPVFPSLHRFSRVREGCSPPLSGNICRTYDARVLRPWVDIVAKPGETASPLNSSSGGGYYFPR